MQTHNERYAIELIQKQNALAKIISVSPYSDRCLNYFLDQLEDPAHNRPLKKIENVHRHRFFDPRDGQWYYRAIEDIERGQPKNTPFTKKTSVSLLPHDGVMHFFTPKHGHSVGLIFDLQFCNLKGEKYIFADPANTDLKWWLKKQGLDEHKHSTKRSLSLNQLRQQITVQRLRSEIPQWSDMLAGVSLESLAAVFAPINQLSDRIKTLYVKQTILAKFKKDLPLLIITPEEGIRVYDLEWQKRDVELVSRWDSIEFPLEFIQNLRKKIVGEEDGKQEISLKNNFKDYEQQIVQAFFVTDIVPLPIKQHALFFLSLVDLLKIKATIKNTPLFDKLNFLIENAITTNQSPELRKIISVLNPEQLFTSPYINTNLFSYQTIFNNHKSDFSNFLKEIISGSRQKEYLELRGDFTERVIGHIFHASSELTKEALIQFSKNNHQTLVKLLLDLGFSPYLEMQNWNFFYSIIKCVELNVLRRLLKSSPPSNTLKTKIGLMGKYYEGIKHSVGNITLSPLLMASLFRDLNVVNEFAYKFPLDITEALQNLKTLETTYYKFHYLELDSNEISSLLSYSQDSYPILTLLKTRTKLLLQLRSQKDCNYTMSYDEKRLVENHLIDCIQKLQTKKEIEDFWSEHKDTLYLNQSRHPWFDRFFRGSNYMPKIKQHVLAALEKRAIAIDSNSAETIPSPACGRGCPKDR